ncbi:DUF3806 domain-containing protein [Luteolibacter sp. Populi]|uniref:DUF3806 domain-containing protein n=1 Tax=Luteolibacter sp. Populi TaxID=3230487 RepID=UPI0034654E9E
MAKITTRPLNSEELATLAGSAEWVNRLLEEEFQSKVRLTGTREDIPNLHTMLEEGPFTEDAKAELKTFGIVFGNVLARELPLRWVVYRDANGTDFALQYEELELFVFPWDLLVKRMEGGEDLGEMDLDLILEELREGLKEEAVRMGKRG